MSNTLQRLLREATRMTRFGDLRRATVVIQRALGAATSAATASADRAARPAASPSGPTPVGRREAHTLDGVVLRRNVDPAHDAATNADAGGGESFTAESHTSEGHTVKYKLYLPPGARNRPLPLVVMLHGCTQNPDDFAIGTAVNDCAREQGFAVLYPAQSAEANPQRCWSWFKRDHQSRGSGEPALLASLTTSVVKSARLDAARVYVAGLSAGGAMADILAAAYPDIFAAVAVHSGLPRGAATHVTGAFAAMKNGAPQRAFSATGPASAARNATPAIVFHGDQDQTVSPKNGAQIVAAALAAFGGDNAKYGTLIAPRREEGVSAGGRRYARTMHMTTSGDTVVEEWVMHGAGHAWSGGSPKGSYTDMSGPDATRQMLRFFFGHRLG